MSWGLPKGCSLRVPSLILSWAQCPILKSSTRVKCYFGCQNFFLIFWALHNNVLCKVLTSQSEGLSKNCLSQNTVATICK